MVFIAAPSMTTPLVEYFHNATRSLRASATMVVLRILRLCHSNDTRSTNGMACREPVSRLSREGAPLDQGGRASLFVNLAGHEMTLLVEMIVDLSLN